MDSIDFSDLTSDLKPRGKVKLDDLTSDAKAMSFDDLTSDIKPVETASRPGFTGALADVGSAVLSGLHSVADMAARGTRALIPGEGSGFAGGEVIDSNTQGAQMYSPETIKTLRDSADSAVNKLSQIKFNNPILRPSVEASTPNSFRGAIYHGVEMGIPVAGMVATGGAGAVAGTTAFGLSAYDRFMEEAEQQGIPEDVAKSQAVKDAFLQGGAALAIDAAISLTGGLLSPAAEGVLPTLRKMFTQPAKTTVAQVIKGAAPNIGIGAIQSGGSAYLRQEAGMQSEDPLVAAGESVGPSIVMSLLLGVGTQGKRALEQRAIRLALSDPRVDEKSRMTAASMVHDQLQQMDPSLATSWFDSASQTIKEKLPISLDQSIIDFATRDVQAAIAKAKEVRKPTSKVDSVLNTILSAKLPEEESNAETVRGNQGQTDQGGQVTQSGESGSSRDLQQSAPDQTGGQVLGQEKVTQGTSTAVDLLSGKEVIPNGNGEERQQEVGQQEHGQQTGEALLNPGTRRVDVAAHEAATSPLNELPQPSDKQKEAGNYKKGHVSIQGLKISIENPRGSVRSGTDKDGNTWESTLQSHYGYLKGIKGRDKDQLDVFIGSNPKSKEVFVINQVDPTTGKFDEHKVMIGFNSEAEARRGYLDNYQAGWQGLKSIVPVKMGEFKTWLKEGNTQKEMAPTKAERTADATLSKMDVSAMAKGVPVTDALKDEVLHKGQPMFSLRFNFVDSGRLPEESHTAATVIDHVLNIIAPNSKVNIRDEVRMANTEGLEAWYKGDIDATVEVPVYGTHETVELTGGQWASIINVALSDNPYIQTTLFHEAFHSVQMMMTAMGTLHTEEAALLNKHFQPLNFGLMDEPERQHWFNKYPELRGLYDSMGDGLNIQSSEHQAIAFAKYANGRVEEGGLKSRIERIFDKIIDFFVKLQNQLRGDGFTSVQEIFGKAFDGEYRKQYEQALKETNYDAETLMSDLGIRYSLGGNDRSPYLDAIEGNPGLGDWLKEKLDKYETLYSTPWWMAKRHPEYKELINVQLKRDENRDLMIERFLSSNRVENQAHEFLALPKSEQESLFKVLIESDRNNEYIEDDAVLQRKGLNPAQTVAYHEWKRTMDKAWIAILNNAKEMAQAPYKEKSWFDNLIEVRYRRMQFEDAVAGFDASTVIEFKQALEALKHSDNQIEKLRSTMGKVKFYVPRVREEGRYVMRVFDQGQLIHSERADNVLSAKKLRTRLEEQYPNSEVMLADEPATAESLYQQINDVALQQFITKAVDKIQSRERITPEDAAAMQTALIEALVDELKTRGFGKHMRTRVTGGPDVQAVAGYKTEGGAQIFVDYATGLSGFLTKQRAAYDFYKVLSTVDASSKPELFNEMHSYIKDMLRNSTDMDRTAAQMRVLPFVWYLVGNLKSAAVQYTQNYITGIPLLGKETKGASIKYHKAMVDVATGNLTQQEKAVLDEAIKKGIDNAQYVREITGKVKGALSDSLRQYVDFFGKPFTGMEVFNRNSAFLAMYRVARTEMEMSHEQAFEKARDFVYDTHYLVGKANLPGWARGGSTGNMLARTAYTFRSFTHNYVLSMVEAAKKGPDGKRNLDAIAKSLAFIGLFGGTTALPFVDDTLDQLEKMTGTPYRTKMRAWLKGVGGDILAKMGTAGIPALMGVDLSGSLKIGLFKPNPEEVYGVYGGLYDKGKRAMELVARHQYMRAGEAISPVMIENFMKAYRMNTEGATTPRGKVIFGEDNQPLKLTTGETVVQALGFRPERVATLSTENRVLSNVEQHYNDRRSVLLDRLAMAHTEQERQEVAKDIEEFNKSVSPLAKIVTPITGRGAISSLKGKLGPDKKTLIFRTLHGGD